VAASNHDVLTTYLRERDADVLEAHSAAAALVGLTGFDEQYPDVNALGCSSGFPRKQIDVDELDETLRTVVTKGR
jgi:Arc/MetJ family transcription regulator